MRPISSPLIDRRRWLAAAVALIVARESGAQPAALPSKPVKLLVGFAPGGAVDIIARALGQQIAPALGQPVVVENKPGAGTNIALRALIDSPPDGHTLMLTANSIAANPTLYQPPPFDMARDFTPVSLIGHVPVVLAVNASSPIDSIAKLIATSKASPRSVSYGTPGNGSTPHLAIALFERAAGTVQALAHLGRAQCLLHLGVQARHHRLRQARGPDNAVPHRGLESREA